MRLQAIGESFVERVALFLGLVPRPLLETQIAFTLARVIMAGCKLGIFDALERGHRTAADVAAACGTEPTATEHLLQALAGTAYVRRRNGGYENTSEGKKWLTSRSKSSFAPKLLLQYYEWEAMGGLEPYVRSGKAFDLHETVKEPEIWQQYQAGMRVLAEGSANEFARRAPVPRAPKTMLDIGGSHGLYSLALCRRYPGLRSTVLELPEAVEHAAAISTADGGGDLVAYRSGNALTDDLGKEHYDLVTIINVVHHFTASQNEELTRKVKTALRPGGICVIGDFVRRDPDRGEGGQVGAIMDLYFAMTSNSGTWTLAEMRGWLETSGLTPLPGVPLRSIPNFALVAGRG
ncbi:MAG: class I SAM-dependent methyltransferase [Acidobacteria bacterium]|nr:class I SAM-dependent methyltransferase [Acidobacteriota bacterium]